MSHNYLKPNYSSTEGEETSGSDSDETDSVEKQQQETNKTLIAPLKSANKPHAPDPSSSEASESGFDTDTDSGSDSDSPPKSLAVVDPNVKPISSMPTERSVKPKDSKLVKKVGSETISTPSLAKSKRPPTALATFEKDPKKAKQNSVNVEPKEALISPSKPAGKRQFPDISSGSDTDLPPKKSNMVNFNVKPKQNSVNVEPKEALISPSKPASKRQFPDICSDTDSDLPPKKSNMVNFNVKPITSVPMESKSVKQSGSNLAKRKPASEKDAKSSSPSKPASKRQVPHLSSSEVEESGSDTDSDLPPKKSNMVDFNVKPITSVPMESKSVKQSGSNLEKRKPASEKDAKKAENTSTAPEDNSKKQTFQRMFSVDDEIAILKGMIDYKVEKNGERHIADISEFHEFIKKSLHVDVSNLQLADKVRRMKKKYLNNARRVKDGKDPSFSKTHEQKAYELSKLIWGSNSHDSGESKKKQSRKNGKLKGNAAGTTDNAASLLTSNGVDDKQKSKMEVEKKIDVSLFVRYGGLNDSLILPEEIVKAGMELVDGSRRAELEVKWKELKEQELVVYVKRMELLKEQAMVVLEAIRSSGN